MAAWAKKPKSQKAKKPKSQKAKSTSNLLKTRLK